MSVNVFPLQEIVGCLVWFGANFHFGEGLFHEGDLVWELVLDDVAELLQFVFDVVLKPFDSFIQLNSFGNSLLKDLKSNLLIP